eukprot:6473539-Alexandrium_andersonii.AAC.1
MSTSAASLAHSSLPQPRGCKEVYGLAAPPMPNASRALLCWAALNAMPSSLPNRSGHSEQSASAANLAAERGDSTDSDV